MRHTRQGGPVVFVPGFMQRGEAWAPVAERIAERYPSTLLDPGTWTVAERVGEIAAASPPGAFACGYSMGGRLALHAAVREPARFGGLILVGASAGIEDDVERAERRAADERLAAWIEEHAIEEVVERWEALPVFGTQPPELVAAQRAGRLSHEPPKLARLLRSAGQGALPSLWEPLTRLRCPVLAIAGELDARYGEAARRIAATAPRGRFALVAGAGHAPQLEAPAAVAALLEEFLDDELREGGLVDRDA